eukprot:5986825-Prymnesium_polylepis.1
MYRCQDSTENGDTSTPGLPWKSTRHRPGSSGDEFVSTPASAPCASSADAHTSTSLFWAGVSAAPRPV